MGLVEVDTERGGGRDCADCDWEGGLVVSRGGIVSRGGEIDG